MTSQSVGARIRQLFVGHFPTIPRPAATSTIAPRRGRRVRRAAALVGVVVAVACTPSGDGAPRPTVGASEGIAGLSPGEARALALAPIRAAPRRRACVDVGALPPCPRGDDARVVQASRLLALAQREVQAPTARAQAWVALGDAWLAWAALTPDDPGVALHARGAAAVALGAAPAHDDAQRLLAQALLTAHEFRAAFDVAAALAAATSDTATRARANALAADAAVELADLDEVDRRLVAVERDDPALVPVRRAYALFLRGDVHGALAASSHAAPTHPREAAFLDADRAAYALAAGDVSGALAASARALAVMGDHPPLLITRARALLAAHALTDASRAEVAEALARAFDRVGALDAGELLAHTPGLLSPAEQVAQERANEARAVGVERAWWIAIHAPSRIAEARTIIDASAPRVDALTRAIGALVLAVEARADPGKTAEAARARAALGRVATVDPKLKDIVAQIDALSPGPTR